MMDLHSKGAAKKGLVGRLLTISTCVEFHILLVPLMLTDSNITSIVTIPDFRQTIVDISPQLIEFDEIIRQFVI